VVKRIPIAVLLALIVVGGVCVLVIPLDGAGAAARRVCRSNLLAVGAALREYASHSGGALPPSLGQLRPDYIDSDRMFICPMDGSTYAYVPGLTLDDSPTTVVVYEEELSHVDVRSVLHLDGTVVLLNEGEPVRGIHTIPDLTPGR